MSQRRSARARSSNTNPTPPSHTASSTSSSTLKRNTQRSESIEDRNPTPNENESESRAAEPVLQPRRSRRNGADDTQKDNTQKQGPVEAEEEELEEENAEEEVTRCVCGQNEYPGLSDSVKQWTRGRRSFTPPHEIDRAATLTATVLEPLPDDLGSFFVQCDQCSVWQHGGCVGFLSEDTLPDEYYCELCKPELHKFIRGSDGVKSTLYRPVLDAQTSRSSSMSSNEQRKKEKNKSLEPAKRRATMNSRGAYDEDEMLRRAIEESKEVTGLGKRNREDTDDPRQAVKRQRTASSASASSKAPSQSPSNGDTGSKSRSTLRGTVARNNKEKEMRDKQKADLAAAKAEAANRRNARSERRRGDDSPPPTPSLSPSKHLSSKSKASTMPADSTPPSTTTAKTKKTAVSRLNARRGRLGRNQYTRDRDLNGDSDTPMRDTSHDRNGIDISPNGVNGNGNGHGGSGRMSKAKTHPARTSMNEMKRRVAAILEFVGQMQTKQSASTSGKDTPNSNGSGSNGKELPVAGLVKAVQAATEEMHAPAAEDGGDGQVNGEEKVKMTLRDDGEFRGLGSADMMETLTKELVAWQSVYGVYSR